MLGVVNVVALIVWPVSLEEKTTVSPAGGGVASVTVAVATVVEVPLAAMLVGESDTTTDVAAACAVCANAHPLATINSRNQPRKGPERGVSHRAPQNRRS